MKISKHTSIFVSVLLLAGLFSNAFAQDAMVEEKASVPMAYEVNINTADAEQLSAKLQGIGVTRAAAIVAYRQEHGEFDSIDEPVRVNGIGESTLEANRELITVGSE